MSLFNKKLIRRILRYLFFVTLLGWILLSIYIGYQYVWFSSDELSSKGGTFVEGIFDATSYLPYLRNDVQSNFYQGLLFNACLKTNASGARVPDLCNVTTTDNQTFTVSFTKGPIRSDGTPVSVDDLYFTYNDIIRNNKWNIPQLSIYKDLIILKDTDNKLKITFSSPSKENILLFDDYILPQHVLKDYDVDNYKNLFGINPVYTNCANLVADSEDPNSLIFNLVNCPDTNLNFYQIKNTSSFDKFKENPSPMIDAYVGSETLNGYTAEKLMTNKLVTVFFNTNSNKLRVRTRRVLGGLIKHNFYTTGYALFMEKNTDGLFDVFQSTGSNAQDLINRDYLDNGITKQDLLDINVQSLPKTIALTGENQKLTHFVDTGSSFPLTFSFTTAYDSVSIEYKGKVSPLSYSKANKSATYTISAANKNFGSGLNKYIIYGTIKKQKKAITSLDIYDMLPTTTPTVDDTIGTGGSGENVVKLTVIYYDSPLYNFVVERMKRIFNEASIADNFIWQKITTPEELQGRLVAGDYDIFVTTVDMGAKKDLTKLFGTDKSELNPSQYQNQKMISLLSDYMQNPITKTLNEINSIYSKDMPFVLLGKVYTMLNIKTTLTQKMFGSGGMFTTFDESNRRTSIYQNLKLVSTIHIDGKRVWNWDNFSLFLEKGLK